MTFHTNGAFCGTRGKSGVDVAYDLFFFQKSTLASRKIENGGHL